MILFKEKNVPHFSFGPIDEAYIVIDNFLPIEPESDQPSFYFESTNKVKGYNRPKN